MVNSLMKEQALSLVNRIDAALSLCNTIFPIMSSQDINTHSPLQPLMEEFNAIVEHIEDFNHNFGNILPASLTIQLSEILEGNKARKISPIKSYLTAAIHPLSALVHCLGRLNILASAIKYELNNAQSLIERKVENAFHHLRYSLVVDKSIQNKWQEVWNIPKGQREPKFEDLGRQHLLSHGIWAYKIDGDEQITDLVYQIQAEVSQTAYGVILSEWKVVKTQKDVENVINNAFTQVEIYSSEVLRATHLANLRYLVIVSEQRMSIKNHVLKNSQGHLFKVFNIAINPGHASTDARKLNSLSNCPAKP